MGRNPDDDKREGKFDDPMLQMRSLRLRRREGLSAWHVAQRIGVSTSTVLQWWGDGAPPAPKPPPQPAPPERRDIVAEWRRHEVARGNHPVVDLVRRSQERYAHQRKMKLAVAGIKDPKRQTPLVAATHTAVGVIVPRRQTKVLPKQVPWMEEW